MNFQQRYINVRKKAKETADRKEEPRTRERKKEKNCERGVFGGTSDFNIFMDEI